MKPFTFLLALTLSISIITVNGQISTPCTVSQLASFSPCVNFITGSSANGGSPNAGCCAAVESLMNTGSQCMCLIVTGNVPVSLPSAINQALAITLPKACNSKRVPMQCKATGVPLPPAGPALFVPPPPPQAFPPSADSPFSPGPSGSDTATLAPTPSDTTPDNLPDGDTRELPDAPPESAPAARNSPAVGSGIRPVLTPAASSSNSLMVSQPVLLVTLVAIVVSNFREVFILRWIL